jgi:hypothetical protein
MMTTSRISLLAILLLAGEFLPQVAMAAEDGAASVWPEVTGAMKPWTYCWWLGSAVDPQNLSRELARYQAAGLGGIHIIPIYGAKGWEDRYIPYLSPRWMEMLSYTVSQARKLGMDADMTLGTGWCFGGPNVPQDQACIRANAAIVRVVAGHSFVLKTGRQNLQAVVAYDEDGKALDLADKLNAAGSSPVLGGKGTWTVYAVSLRPVRTPVKRAAPGGEGPMLNPFYEAAIRHYLLRFSEAFAAYSGPRPRAVYQDSYEYQSAWSPDLFAEFQKRRGYRLQEYLPEIFGAAGGDRAARVKCDFRETISDMMVENFMPPWVQWAHDRGMLTRDQAHGSPGNLLDLYAAADIPETEMFSRDRELLVCKFASSAGHVAGRKLVSSETGTWLAEHFTETLGDMKRLVDEMFVSGINHVFYHGTCYSSDDAAWPGWLFYVATEMNPRNPIWRDVPALNAYIARCQSFLQAGQSDNDILLYWPIHDLWHDSKGLLQTLTVHHRDWLNKQPLGATARRLWTRGYAFDYVSDRQLSGNARAAADGSIHAGGQNYRAIVVPPCTHMPPETMERLKQLAGDGAVVIFQDGLPKDVPGLGELDKRRKRLQGITADLGFRDAASELREAPIREAPVGKGRFLVGSLEAALRAAQVGRETLVDRGELMFVRRKDGAERRYFVCNHGNQEFNGWVTLAVKCSSALLLDPMTGRAGQADARRDAQGKTQIYLQLPPGGSLILRTDSPAALHPPAWPYWRPDAAPLALDGTWKIEFIEGGPHLPKSIATARLASWTDLGDDEALRFGGTARYRIEFDSPKRGKRFLLDLGRVCQSARVRVNGRDLGALILSPYRTIVEDLKPSGNLLEVEVTNVAANRIRDLDRRHVAWRVFHDINFASVNYKSFDASNWPLYDSGLLGPVTLQPVVDGRP